MNRTAFLKKLHTEKSVIIQQYQPAYPAVYNIVINQKSLDNVAHVLYQDGRELVLQGEKCGIDFRNLEQPELNQTVGEVLLSVEAEQQKNLWHRLGLDAYQRIFPIQNSHLPYFNLCKNPYGHFAYCPLAKEKFAFLVPDSYGQIFMGSDHRSFGAYDNDLKSTLDDSYHLDNVGIASALCEYEPAAVWGYEESRILEKLNRMTQETNARPFIFQQPGVKPIVSMPEEVQDYLTPTETELAKKLVVLQDSAGDIAEESEVEEPALQTAENTPAEEEIPAEEAGPEMSM